MDEDQNSVNTEITPQDQHSEVDVKNSSNNFSEDNPHVEGDQEKNWKQLRKKADKADELEKKIYEYEKRMLAHEEVIKNILSQHKNISKEPDEFENIASDDFLSYEQTRKLLQRDARNIARQEFEALESAREKNRFRERLKSKYSDFDLVVNDSTIKLFEQKEPELAATIAESQDPYKMGLQTYMYIKSMGLYDDNEDRHSKEVIDKIDKNKKSIQTPQAYDKRPMAQAFDFGNLSKSEKEKLYTEMMGYASLSSGF